MLNTTLQHKAMTASKYYIDNMGMILMPSDALESRRILVADDGYSMRIIRVDAGRDGFPEVPGDSDMRSEMEGAAVEFLADNPDCVDVPVVFDFLQLWVISDSRAFLRYTSNALGFSF